METKCSVGRDTHYVLKLQITFSTSPRTLSNVWTAKIAAIYRKKYLLEFFIFERGALSCVLMLPFLLSSCSFAPLFLSWTHSCSFKTQHLHALESLVNWEHRRSLLPNIFAVLKLELEQICRRVTVYTGVNWQGSNIETNNFQGNLFKCQIWAFVIELRTRGLEDVHLWYQTTHPCRKGSQAIVCHYNEGR